MSEKIIPPLSPEEGESKDLISENIEKLKKLFPEIVTDGKIDFEALKENLGEFREKSDERYSFTWNGKSQAKKLAMIPSRGTLRPAPEESVKWDTSEHLFIEGDNLEVLKLLQRSYHKKVKMIYIDPPYNTGKDFVYPDDFKDSIANYRKLTGQEDDEGKLITNNPEYSGRYHTDWLNMIYPRLKLARELLKDEGCIFISIDDHEMANIKKICDEIFGEENFVTTIIWQRAFSPKNDAKYISDNHDYILFYCKDINNFESGKLDRTDEQNNRYTDIDKDPRGAWVSGDLTVKTYNEKYDYPITTPSGRVVRPSHGSCWRVSKERFEELKKDNRIWFGVEGNNVPRIKRFRSEVQDGVVATTLWLHDEVGHNQEGRQELKKLFDGKGYFDGPKPLRLLQKLIKIGNVKADGSEIILDFFAGSSSTAHAVLLSNKADDGNRRYVMIQLPEKIKETNDAYKSGYVTIADIATDRLRRAGSILKDKSENKNDLGFKAFKLETSNIKQWDPSFDEVQLSIEDSIENIKSERSEQDVLYEILLKYGLDLAIPIEERTIGSAKIYIAGAGALVLCLSDHIDLEVVEGIAAVKKELNPEIMRVVFRDSGFKDDVVKTNAVQILRQHGIEDVRSI